MASLIDPAVEREDVAEALAHLVHASKREMPVVGTLSAPTPWDRLHTSIDKRLYEWQALSG